VDLLWPPHLLPADVGGSGGGFVVRPAAAALAAVSSGGSAGEGAVDASTGLVAASADHRDTTAAGASTLAPGGAPAPGLQPLRAEMTLVERLRRVRDCIARCDTSPDADVVVFVSKMVAVPKDALPEHGYIEGLGGRSVAAPIVTAALAPTPPSVWYGLEPHASSAGGGGGGGGETCITAGLGGTSSVAVTAGGGSASHGLDLRGVAAKGTGRLLRRTGRHGADGGDGSGSIGAVAATSDGMDLSAGETFVAFARVFSGTLRPGA